jgi:GYF domain 2
MPDDYPEWYIWSDGKQRGPIAQQDLEALDAAGALQPSDLLWRQPWPDWIAASKVFDRNPGKLIASPDSDGPSRNRPLLMLALALIGVVGALGGGLISNWQTFFPKKTTSVEDCDRTLGSVPPPGGRFSGIYAGLVEDANSKTEVQLTLVRNTDTVQGSYFRAGVCGVVVGKIVDDKMRFHWSWAGGSGLGIAAQEGTTLTASSGYDQAAEGGGTLVLFQRAN